MDGDLRVWHCRAGAGDVRLRVTTNETPFGTCAADGESVVRCSVRCPGHADRGRAAPKKAAGKATPKEAASTKATPKKTVARAAPT